MKYSLIFFQNSLRCTLSFPKWSRDIWIISKATSYRCHIYHVKLVLVLLCKARNVLLRLFEQHNVFVMNESSWGITSLGCFSL